MDGWLLLHIGEAAFATLHEARDSIESDLIDHQIGHLVHHINTQYVNFSISDADKEICLILSKCSIKNRMFG